MTEIKEIFKIILTIIEKVGPTLATLSAVYLAYLYTKRQKLFEDKSESQRRIRVIVSHLIQIWRELSTIEYYAASENYYADLVFTDKQFASNYFNIDLERIEKFKKLFENSKEQVKSVNVVLFYSLESSYLNFQKSLQLIDTSENKVRLNDDDIKVALNTLLKETVRDIEQIISETAENLPKKEYEQIITIINEHHISLKETNFEFDVPNFLIDLINKYLPVKEDITSEEIKYFLQDSTIQLLYSKFTPVYRNLFINKKPVETIQVVIDLIKNPENIDLKFNENEFISLIELNESENNMFKNNLGFYKMACAVFKKFTSEMPIEFKRVLIKINNGEIDIMKKIEAEKKRLLSINASA